MSATRRMVIVGAAGVAREVRWVLDTLAEAGHPYRFVGYVMSDLTKAGPLDSQGELLGDFSWLGEHRKDFDGLALAIGNPHSRARVVRLLEPQFDLDWWPSLVHPTAIVDKRSCTLGPGTIVQAGTVMTVGVTLDAFAMVHFGCTVGHETRCGRASAVYPGANLGGGVQIGEAALIGSGAQVLQYLRVGSRAVVGAGSVVTRDVPAECTVMGVPARLRSEHESGGAS